MTRPRIIALDTEDDSEGTVTLINFFDGETHIGFHGENMRPRAWDYLQRIGFAHVWACNMEYDLVNLFGWEWLGKLVTLQYVSAGFMRGSYCEGPITFYDTLRHWPASVAKMGEEIGLPKMDAVFDGSMPFDELQRYCERDTEIVWRYTTAMLARYDDMGLSIRATLPGMALQLFRKDFYTKSFVRLPPTVMEFFRSGYYGGRVEVFKMGVTMGPFSQYDVNSLYPSVMAAGKFPSLHNWYETTRPDWSYEGMADVTMEYPYHTIPALPVRHEKEILYPYGRLRGVWCYPEIRQALRDGGTILRVHRACEFPETESPFTSYVDAIYARRMASDSDVDKTIYKLFMNALYGKFGQSNDGMVTIFNDVEIANTSNKSSEHVNVIWSAYTTSYGRLHLLQLLRACSAVYYSDTDSLFTPDTFPTSTTLGGLKLEGKGVIVKGNFKGNKLYLITREGADGSQRETAKAKGVRASEAAGFIRTGRAVFRRPARFRESRKNFVTANVWYEVEKREVTQYSKRRLRRDGSGYTEPWALNEYERQVSAIRVRGQRRR